MIRLISTNADPMFYQVVAWASRVISIVPKRPVQVGMRVVA